MDFYEKQYPKRIIHISYDNLVKDQIKMTRKLIDTLNLPWEEACLEPHKNTRTVKTASQQQVRRKIYTGSSAKWKKFEPFLNGIFDELR